MPLDVDGLIRKGAELKRAGGTGRQFTEFLEREGASEEARRFITSQVDKLLLEEHAERSDRGHRFMKGFLGAALMAGGAYMAWYLWTGIEGWNIIAGAPFLVLGAGLWMLTSRS